MAAYGQQQYGGVPGGAPVGATSHYPQQGYGQGHAYGQAPGQGYAASGYQPPKAAGQQAGYTPVGATGGYGYDPEAGGAGAGAGGGLVGFDDTMVRLGFIRKVYGILSMQLAVTLLFTLVFTLSDRVKTFVFDHPGFIWSAYAITLATIIALACCGNLRREYPTNYILLTVFTLAESYLVGCISATYQTQVVLMALIATMACMVGLTVYAFTTKRDFTMMGGSLMAALFVLIMMGFLSIWWHSEGLNLVYAGFGAMLFCVFIVYDTQIMIGGRHKKYSISPDEYVFAALNLYLDVVNLFLYLLALFGSGSRR